MESGERPPALTKTRQLKANEPGSIALAAELLKQGYLIVFPTDTLYGVGADAFNATAVARLYQVKQRPLQKGIPVLLADRADLAKVAREIPAIAAAYIDGFWPGPLTLIVPKNNLLPAIISPNEGVAVRIPAHDVARALIKAAGGALAVSSANRSGQTPAQDAAQAWAALGGLVAAIVDDGPSPGDVASTIVDCTGAWPKILREGPIQAQDLLTPTLLRAGSKAS